jgi:hypothetical protein
MKAALLRTLGFALPTLVLATTLHLDRDRSVGEAIDGLISGLWFALLFLVGGSIGVTVGQGRLRRRRHAAIEVIVGVAAALVTWTLLFLLWKIPQAEPLRSAGFPINSAIVLAAGTVLFLALRDGGAPAEGWGGAEEQHD